MKVCTISVNRFRTVAGSILIIFALVGGVLSQSSVETEVVGPQDSKFCEKLAAIFDVFVQYSDNKEKIIVIATRGRKDKKTESTNWRLHNAKWYLTEFYKGTGYERSSEAVITAISIEETEYGSLSFYLKGKNLLKIEFDSDRYFFYSPCVIEPGKPCTNEIEVKLYPCLERIKKASSGKRGSN